MRLSAEIHRKIGNFELDAAIESDARRVGILGASGSGKSMTLRSIAGIEDVDSGHIEVNGRVLFDSENRINLKPQKRNVGYMFQNYALFPTMSVIKNVMAGLRGSAEENRAKASEMLARFRMDGYEDRLPGELSGGQQQRVLLARALCATRRLLLLDEPVSGLDPVVTAEMYQLIQGLNDEGLTVIMISHDIEAAVRYATHILHIGERIFFGTRDEYISGERGFVTAAGNFEKGQMSGNGKEERRDAE